MTRYPRLQLLSLVVVFTAAFFGTAEAKKPKPLPTRPEVHRLTGSSPIIRLGPAGPAEGPCSGGAAFDPFDIYDGYLDPVGGADSYYSLVDPATCSACAPDSQLKVTQVHVDLAFPVSCTQPVVITFLGTRPLAGVCTAAPDTGSQFDGWTGACTGWDLTCSVTMDQARSVTATFADDTPPTPTIRTPMRLDGDAVAIFDLTLPQPVILAHPAFVGMTFNTFGNCVPPAGGNQTNLVIADSALCEPCKYFNYYFDLGGLFRADYCAANANHYGPPVLSVSGTCGQYVPVLPATWGQLKVRYATPRRRRRRAGTRRARRSQGEDPNSRA